MEPRRTGGVGRGRPTDPRRWLGGGGEVVVGERRGRGGEREAGGRERGGAIVGGGVTGEGGEGVFSFTSSSTKFEGK